MIKALKKLGIEGKSLKIIKVHYDKPTVSIIINREKMKPFPLKSRKRQGYIFLLFFFFFFFFGVVWFWLRALCMLGRFATM
jgi:hypothetical protein